MKGEEGLKHGSPTSLERGVLHFNSWTSLLLFFSPTSLGQEVYAYINKTHCLL